MSHRVGRPAWKRWPYRVITIALALMVYLPAGELVTRMMLTLGYRNTLDPPSNGPINDPDRHITLGRMLQSDPDPKLAYRMRPGTRAVYSNVKTEINAMGFRDDEITTTKPAQTLRVIGLGDAAMFGQGVHRHQPYMDLLESEFRNLLRNKWNVEFVNMGTPGYNTTQEVELFLNSGLRLDPDAVLIQLDGNSLSAPINKVRPDYLFACRFFLAHPLELGRGEYSNPSAFFLLSQQDRLSNPRYPGAGWQAVAEACRRLAAACRERQIPLFGLLNFEDPTRMIRLNTQDPFYQQLLDLSRELGITPIEVQPLIQAQQAKASGKDLDIMLYSGNLYPNPSGHALITQAALPALRDALLKKTALQPDQLDQYHSLGNIALRQSSATGLHQPEIWDGYVANWTDKQAHLHFLPAGRQVVIPLMISAPDVSETNPVTVTLRIDGVPTSRHPASALQETFSIAMAGYTKRTVDISGLDGCPLELTVTVNRTFHTATDQRPLGVGLYEFSFIP